MRVNEYNSLNEFTSEFIGVWGPSDNHWFGLDFEYRGTVYRLHTGPMRRDDPRQDSCGSEILFGLYKVQPQPNGQDDFLLLASFAAMEDLLCYSGIDGREFREVIMDDSTRILGKD